MVQTLKTCKKCLIEKPKSEFDKDSQGKVSRHTCRICRNKRRCEYHTRRGLGLKRKRLSYQYGITLEQYNSMVKLQNNLCLLCNRTNLNQWGTDLVVDHCHSTGKVRGLLCDKCNKGLGQFEDNIEVMIKAINYLKVNR